MGVRFLGNQGASGQVFDFLESFPSMLFACIGTMNLSRVAAGHESALTVLRDNRTGAPNGGAWKSGPEPFFDF